MKFYNREQELQKIKDTLASETSDFVYISGRRRIGKTSLIQQAFQDIKYLYFFIGNTEGLLLKSMEEEIRQYT